jgi:DNA-directed RNA polymerase specialized sigma24 family protein
MASLSPSDLLWVLGSRSQGLWILPVLREAIRAEWPGAEYAAKAQLGDASMARELMECAIEQTQEFFSGKNPAELIEVRKTLNRYYRNGLRRVSRKASKLSFRGDPTDLETLSPLATAPHLHIEARLDLKALLADTPPELRHALLMRYGTRTRWEEVAHELSHSSDGIRMRCQRELKRLRNTLGLKDRGGHESS